MPVFEFVLVIASVAGFGFTSEVVFRRERPTKGLRGGDDKKLSSCLRPLEFLSLGCAGEGEVPIPFRKFGLTESPSTSLPRESWSRVGEGRVILVLEGVLGRGARRGERVPPPPPPPS